MDDNEVFEHEQGLHDAYEESPDSLASNVAAEDGEDLLPGSTTEAVTTSANGGSDDAPRFAPLTAMEASAGRRTFQKVHVPPNRLSPLQKNWMDIYTPIAQHMKLQIRFDTVKKCIELQTCDVTENPQALQKAADFCRAFCLGFELRDAIALLRLDDLYIDSFQFKEVKLIGGEDLSRAIGRVTGYNGRTKYTIENATKTRVVVADGTVHILGSYKNIRFAKDAIVRLIIGSPPGKIYNQMRNVTTITKGRL